MTDCDDAVTEVSDSISQLSWLLLLHHNHDDDELSDQCSLDQQRILAPSIHQCHQNMTQSS